jgi:hypothetical protein
MRTLHHITNREDPLTSVIKDDPVRAHIPLEQRVNDRAQILLLKEGDRILAATCMQWATTVPEREEDLLEPATSREVAVFYTIWSYEPGAGAELIKQAADWILSAVEDVKNIVTLSPQTEMARRFHLKNGARVRKTNETSVNYEYYSREAENAKL